MIFANMEAVISLIIHAFLEYSSREGFYPLLSVLDLGELGIASVHRVWQKGCDTPSETGRKGHMASP